MSIIITGLDMKIEILRYIDKADSWAIKESTTVTQNRLSNVLDIFSLFGIWGVKQAYESLNKSCLFFVFLTI